MNRPGIIEALDFDPAKVAGDKFGTEWVGPTLMVRNSVFVKAVDLATQESLKADRYREALEEAKRHLDAGDPYKAHTTLNDALKSE